jgi:hypothetical protein
MNPVALVVYNRPGHTAQVLDALRDLRPEPFYVFSDAAKDKSNAQAVQDVREIVAETVDWTQAIVIEHAENRGLRRSIVYAVAHVLNEHETVTLLEDDCVPGPYFLDFVNACLEKYARDGRVLGVTGYTVPVPQDNYPWDCYFFPRPGSWGWATWRRAWRLYEADFPAALDRAKRDGVDLTVGGADIPGLVQGAIDGRLDAWTPGWLTAVARHGYFVYPTQSHIQNIGFDGTGVHCGKSDRYDTPAAVGKPSRFPDAPFVDDRIAANFRSYY